MSPRQRAIAARLSERELEADVDDNMSGYGKKVPGFDPDKVEAEYLGVPSEPASTPEEEP